VSTSIRLYLYFPLSTTNTPAVTNLPQANVLVAVDESFSFAEDIIREKIPSPQMNLIKKIPPLKMPDKKDSVGADEPDKKLVDG